MRLILQRVGKPGRSRSVRQGFTLIEVIAAIAISTVLLAAVYMTLGLMLSSVRAGKEAIASLQIVRGTAVRLKADIRQSLGMLAATPSVESALASTQQQQTQSPQGGAQGAQTQQQQPEVEPAQFNWGLQGDEMQMTLYASRMPRYSQFDAEIPNSVFSDLRVITYAVQQQGLVRQEVLNVLTDAGDQTLVEILAPEVTEARFQYWDPVAKSWVGQWDGSINGPPAAVEITLTIQMPEKPGMPISAPFTHRLVIAIPTFGSLAQGVVQ